MNPVVILAVIYNSYSEVFRFVESIGDCFGHEVKVILVDNSENQPDSLFIEKIQGIDFITYIKSETNLGYFHGAQTGLMHFLRNNHIYPQWTIVCNVDIIFKTRNLLKKLEYYDHLPDLGIMAPAIISNKWKTDANPFRFSRISLCKLEFLLVMYSNVLLHNGYVLLHFVRKFMKMIFQLMPSSGKGKVILSQNIYAPYGSCIIFNKKYFETGGTLDHISFLFGEEIFVGETAKNIGLNILYVPEIEVHHYEHSSIGNFISRRINKFYRQSIVDIINHYYDKPSGK